MLVIIKNHIRSVFNVAVLHQNKHVIIKEHTVIYIYIYLNGIIVVIYGNIIIGFNLWSFA